MTDTSSIVATHSIPPQFPVTAPPLASPLTNGIYSETHLDEEEESYTIKCICPFADDDGSTVQCDKCETWQHILCYYPTKRVPDTHKCTDCEPRSLDARRATERQIKVREQIDGGDRKTKRPVTKSHKKRPKETNATGEHINGWHTHERHESAPIGRDQPPPAKRPKTSHRTSGSVSSQVGTPVLQPDSRRQAGSSAQKSPIKSPLNPTFPLIPTYSPEFLELYDCDEGNVSMQANIFNNIALAGTLASAVQDPEVLENNLGVRQPHAVVFNKTDQPLDASTWPRTTRERQVDFSVDYDGKHPSWQCLKVREDVRKDGILGEVKGQIGHLADYSLDSANRWQELHHPEPFVFFHPQLPIYVDCRKEGTEFRYARRSCNANMGMKTIITNESEFHFCFTARTDIPADTELTVNWYLFPSLFNDGLIKGGTTSDDDVDAKRQWISRALANFGGCACNGPQPCAFAPYDMRRPPKALEAAAKQVNGQRKKNKTRHLISPLSTGQANNSRAGSETMKQQDEDDPSDSRSTSTSLRSKPGSRDHTPTGHTLSNREKMKIAQAEKNFERLEQDAHGQKKKKRTSGGSTLSTPTVNTSKHMGYLSNSISNPTTPSTTFKQPYADASVGSQVPGSPQLKSSYLRNNSNNSPTQNLNANSSMPSAQKSKYRNPRYVDKAMQSDPTLDPYDGRFIKKHPPGGYPKRGMTWVEWKKKNMLGIIAEAKRKRAEEDIAEKARVERIYGVMPTADSPSVTTSNLSVSSPVTASKISIEDTMKPAGEDESTILGKAPTPDPLSGEASQAHDTTTISDSDSRFKPPPPPFPSQAAHSHKMFRPPNGVRLGLHIANFPPPGISNPSPGTPSSTTPSTMTPSVAQSPFSSALSSSNSYPGLQMPGAAIVAPSPVKKKLSLGDYMNRKNNQITTPAIEKTQANAPAVVVNSQQLPAVMLKPNESILEEAQSEGIEDSAVVDTPMKDVTSPGKKPFPPTLAPTAPTPNSSVSVSRDPRLQ